MRKALGLAVILAFVIPASATIYVDPAGSDATGDGSAGNPYQTLQYAAWVANAIADPIIEAAPGTYAGFYNESAPSGGLGSVPGPGNLPQAPVISLTVQSSNGGTDWKNTVINSPVPYASPTYFPQAGAATVNPYADVYGGGAECSNMPFVSLRGSADGYDLELRGFTVRGDALDVSSYAGHHDAGGADSRVWRVSAVLATASRSTRRNPAW